MRKSNQATSTSTSTRRSFVAQQSESFRSATKCWANLSETSHLSKLQSDYVPVMVSCIARSLSALPTAMLEMRPMQARSSRSNKFATAYDQACDYRKVEIRCTYIEH
jgi:hypothetical protein